VWCCRRSAKLSVLRSRGGSVHQWSTTERGLLRSHWAMARKRGRPVYPFAIDWVGTALLQASLLWAEVGRGRSKAVGGRLCAKVCARCRGRGSLHVTGSTLSAGAGGRSKRWQTRAPLQARWFQCWRPQEPDADDSETTTTFAQNTARHQVKRFIQQVIRTFLRIVRQNLTLHALTIGEYLSTARDRERMGENLCPA
jgi:hypothetical protein